MLTLVAALLTASPLPLSLTDGAPFRDVESGFTFMLPGSDVKVKVEAGDSLRVQDLAKFAGGGPDGAGLIDWSWSSGNNTHGTTLRFSRPLSFFSVEAGDWSGDDDGALVLEAFDCDGRRVAHQSVKWGTSGPPFAAMKLSAQGMCSVHYRSGGQFGGSTFLTAFAGE